MKKRIGRPKKMARQTGKCRARPNYVPYVSEPPKRRSPGQAVKHYDPVQEYNPPRPTVWQFIERRWATVEDAVEHFNKFFAGKLQVRFHPGVTYVVLTRDGTTSTLAAVPAATWQMALAEAVKMVPGVFSE